MGGRLSTNARSTRAKIRVVPVVGGVEEGRTLATERARGSGGHVAPPKAIRPAVIRPESTIRFPASEFTQGEFDEQRGSDADNGTHHPGFCTVGGVNSSGDVLEEAPITRFARGTDTERRGDPADCGALDVGTALEMARIIDEKLRCEVVGALHDQIDGFHKIACVVWEHAGSQGHVTGRRVGAEPAERRDPRVQLVAPDVRLTV
jgi:hypothetical protein